MKKTTKKPTSAPKYKSPLDPKYKEIEGLTGDGALIKAYRELEAYEETNKRLAKELLETQSNFAAIRTEFDRMGIQNGKQFKLLSEIDEVTSAMYRSLTLCLPDKDLRYRVASLFLAFLLALQEKKAAS